MRRRIPHGRHLFALAFLLIELPIIAALVAGAAVTGTIYGSVIAWSRARDFLSARRILPRSVGDARKHELAHA